MEVSWGRPASGGRAVGTALAMGTNGMLQCADYTFPHLIVCSGSQWRTRGTVVYHCTALSNKLSFITHTNPLASSVAQVCNANSCSLRTGEGFGSELADSPHSASKIYYYHRKTLGTRRATTRVIQTNPQNCPMQRERERVESVEARVETSKGDATGTGEANDQLTVPIE